MSPALIAPTAGLHTSWLRARDELDPGTRIDGSGLLQHDVEIPAGPASWTQRMRRCADPATTPAPGRLCSTSRRVVEDDTSPGTIALRPICAVIGLARVLVAPTPLTGGSRRTPDTRLGPACASATPPPDGLARVRACRLAHAGSGTHGVTPPLRTPSSPPRTSPGSRPRLIGSPSPSSSR